MTRKKYLHGGKEMRINTNIPALNTYRQLTTNNSATQNSLEKLSSGLRINKAGDDAAGLAISEKMRGQIRGLEQAKANAQDGISMIQTAEGALNETQSILQRMRELAVQASNDTNTESDRGEIQKEINQLTSEINRIGNTTEFNTQSLLKGSENAKELQPALNLDATGLVTDGTLAGGGVNAAVNASLDIAFTGVTGDGAASGETITFNLSGEEFTINITSSDAGGDGETLTDVTANSASINLDTDAGNTNTDATTANEYAALVKDALNGMIEKNSNISSTDFEATVSTDTVTIKALDGGNFEAGAGSIVANASDAANWNGTATTQADTGTNESYNYATDEIDLSSLATDAEISALEGQGITVNGQSIEFYNADNGEYDGKADFAVNISSILNGADDGTEDEELVSAIVSQIGDKLEGVTLSAGTAASDLKITATEGGDAGNEITFSDGVDRQAVTSAGTFSATFQVGANTGQSMTIEIGDMRASALGLTGEAGTEGFSESDNVTNGTNNESVEAALDVTSAASASNAIETINKAIEDVSAQRSNLGAFQNRLDHTINNLGTSAENLTAAESRIRDVDMAKEMMEFTKNNILSQAAQAMLAQANQQPQGVLQLLR